MSQADLFVNFFVALFALIDPVGNVPVFAAATSGATAQQRRLISIYIGLFIFAFLTLFYFTGLALLEFFGISMPAFRIAGGIILFLLGLDMARDDFTAMFADTDAENLPKDLRGYARKRFEKLIVPFAIPLLIGPGAISTVVIFASDATPLGVPGMVGGVTVIAMASLSVILCFWATPIISKLLGKIGLTIVVRVLGLILCAMAVQFVIAGVGDATRGIIRPAAAAPYAAGH
jgi:multiple antibiotic resistance protein